MGKRGTLTRTPDKVDMLMWTHGSSGYSIRAPAGENSKGNTFEEAL